MWSYESLGATPGTAGPTSGAGAGVGDVAGGESCLVDSDCATEGHVCTASALSNECGLVCKLSTVPFLSLLAQVPTCSDFAVRVADVSLFVPGAAGARIESVFVSSGMDKSPLLVGRDPDSGLVTLSLAKAVQNGTSVVSLQAVLDDGSPMEMDLQVDVTCPIQEAHLHAEHVIDVAADLVGFRADDFTAGGAEPDARISQLRSDVAASLGVALEKVTFDESRVQASEQGVTVGLLVGVPASVLTENSTVAVALDVSQVATQPLRLQSNAFVHLGRTIGRTADVCCTGTVTRL